MGAIWGWQKKPPLHLTRRAHGMPLGLPKLVGPTLGLLASRDGLPRQLHWGFMVNKQVGSAFPLTLIWACPPSLTFWVSRHRPWLPNVGARKAHPNTYPPSPFRGNLFKGIFTLFGFGHPMGNSWEYYQIKHCQPFRKSLTLGAWISLTSLTLAQNSLPYFSYASLDKQLKNKNYVFNLSVWQWEIFIRLRLFLCRMRFCAKCLIYKKTINVIVNIKPPSNIQWALRLSPSQSFKEGWCRNGRDINSICKCDHVVVVHWKFVFHIVASTKNIASLNHNLEIHLCLWKTFNITFNPHSTIRFVTSTYFVILKVPRNPF